MKKKSLKTKIVSVFILAILSVGIFAMPAFAASVGNSTYDIVLENESTVPPLPEATEEPAETAKPGSVASVVNKAYDNIKDETEVVFFRVIVNAIRVILAIGFFFVCAFAWRNHHQGQGVNWTRVVFLGVCLAASIVLPGLLWDIV